MILERMKLYVVQDNEKSVSGRAFKVYDEAGRRLPGITRASVHHEIGDAVRIDLSLVVNDRDIHIGFPPVKDLAD